ncbi:MAG: serine/threonine protein kinase [Sandaracinaceae bacterium]
MTANALDLSSLPPGPIAGRYEVLAPIAAGGMAAVFLARARTGAGFGKLVALKCIRPELAREQAFIQMFLDEARVSMSIDHPNVATVFDAGEDRGTYYLAMEYLHGETLHAVLRRWAKGSMQQPSDATELIARVVADAAAGLHAAHELRGRDGTPLDVVHRDVSPQNIFLTYGGAVKVVDFGIMKALGRLQPSTVVGALKGKAAYMSPEQLEARPLDRRSDVWALGVVLWEGLTSRRLFKRDQDVETIGAILEWTPPAPSSIEPTVSADLDRIVHTALSRDPAGRYATARDLASDLNAAIAKRGQHVGMQEVADRMRATLGARIAERDAWLESARQRRPTAALPAVAFDSLPPPRLASPPIAATTPIGAPSVTPSTVPPATGRTSSPRPTSGPTPMTPTPPGGRQVPLKVAIGCGVAFAILCTAGTGIGVLVGLRLRQPDASALDGLEPLWEPPDLAPTYPAPPPPSRAPHLVRETRRITGQITPSSPLCYRNTPAATSRVRLGPGEVELSARATAFTAVLFVESPSGTRYFSADAWGGDLTLELTEAGLYTVGVTCRDPEDCVGFFDVVISAWVPAPSL